MKLVGPWLSGYTRRTAMTLRLLELPFEHINLNAYLDKEEVRRYSPMGKVPALILDDGEVLFDSGSVIDFLHETVGPERALLPPSGAPRRRALKLVGVGLAVYGKLSGIFDEILRPESHRLASVKAGLTEQALIGFKMLEEATQNAWLVGDRVSQADIMTIVCYQAATLFVLPEHVTAGTFPRIAALAERAMKLYAFASTLPRI